MTAADDDQLVRLQKLDSTVVSDALDRLGLRGATVGIGPLTVEARTVVGRCRTVEVGPIADAQPRPHLASAAIEGSDDGSVLVIANGGRTDVSSWGGILSYAAVQRGIRGVIVDGACRDRDEISALGLPVFGRAVVPVSARGRITELSHGQSVDIAGVSVAPDDIVIADGNGVVFIPHGCIEAVLAAAEDIAVREAEIVEAIKRGQSIVEAMHDSMFDGEQGSDND